MDASVATTSAAANGTPPIGRLARKPKMLPRCLREGIAIRPHNVFRKKVAVPWLYVRATGGEKRNCKQEENESALVHDYFGGCVTSVSISFTNSRLFTARAAPGWIERILPSPSSK
jgi:hypothetical protein